MENSQELYDSFRSEVGDEVAPLLWTDENVYEYMNDAYRTFVRKTGGIPDSLSDLTQIPVVTGERNATLSPLILRVRQAYLVSTGEEITIVNQLDPLSTDSLLDYGEVRRLANDTSAGPVRYMMTGLDRTQAGGVVRWVQVPVADDTVGLVVYRLPLNTIDVGDGGFTFPDIGQEHIEKLLLHMKARAYGKQDADAFDKAARDTNKREFEQYCTDAKAEWERFKHKPRSIQYGGI